MIFASYLLLIAWASFSINAQKPPPKPMAPGNIKCHDIHGDVELHMLMIHCEGNVTLRGSGYLILDDAKEHEIHDFFEEKSRIMMGIRIWAHPSNPVVVDFGQLELIGRGNEVFRFQIEPFSDDQHVLGLWIENTNVERIIAPKIKAVYGVRIRGNKFLKNDSIGVYHDTEDPTKIKNPKAPPFVIAKLRYRRVQNEGECNIDPYNNNFPNFTGCVYMNNLILKDQERIPATFQPKFISGCVVVQFSISEHDWMKEVDTEHSHSFECSKYNLESSRLTGLTLAINRNKQLCIREDTPLLLISQVSTMRNGNPQCRFHCTTVDIYKFGQRYCVFLEGDLIIDDFLARDVNITEVTMALERIEGSIIISELNFLKPSTGVDYIDLRALVAVTAGENYREAAVTVENSTLRTILFENLTTLSGYEKAFEVNEWNPHFNISDETLFLIETAANGRDVIVMKYKNGIEEESEEPEEEETDAGTIAGITIGSIAAVLIVALVVLGVVLYVKKRKQKKSNKRKGEEKKKDKSTDGEKDKLIETAENEKSTATNVPGISMDDAPDYENMEAAPSKAIAADANYENLPASTATKPVANDENYENMPVTAPMKSVVKDENYANMPTATAMKTVSKDANYANMPKTAALKTVAKDENYENLPTAAPTKPVTKRANYTKMATAAPAKASVKADENYENMSTLAGPSKIVTKNANYANMPSKVQTKAADADDNYENLAPAASKMTGKTRAVSQFK